MVRGEPRAVSLRGLGLYHFTRTFFPVPTVSGGFPVAQRLPFAKRSGSGCVPCSGEEPVPCSVRPNRRGVEHYLWLGGGGKGKVGADDTPTRRPMKMPAHARTLDKFFSFSQIRPNKWHQFRIKFLDP